MPINPNNPNIKNSGKETPNSPNVIEDIFEHEDGGGNVNPREQSPDVTVPEKSVEQVERKVETETTPETTEQKPREKTPEDEMSQQQPAPAPVTEPDKQPVQQKSMELVKIENILSENLDELFLQMTPQQQMQFKVKGEETATKIESLLQETKVRVKEIITLIKEWLKIIPGVNKFFLEQEAKIKTDRLLNIREQKK